VVLPARKALTLLLEAFWPVAVAGVVALEITMPWRVTAVQATLQAAVAAVLVGTSVAIKQVAWELNVLVAWVQQPVP
jgi:hypothetical protein